MIRMYFTRFFGALTLALAVLVTYTLGAVLLGPGHGPGLPQGIVMAVMIVLFVLHGWTWLRSEGRGIVEAYPQGYQFDGLTKAADKARASVATCLQAAGEGMDVSIAYEFEHPRKGATWTWGTLESWTDAT